MLIGQTLLQWHPLIFSRGRTNVPLHIFSLGVAGISSASFLDCEPFGNREPATALFCCLNYKIHLHKNRTSMFHYADIFHH